MSTVVLKNISKSYGEVVAVANLDLSIRQGDFVSLLGPSGCGKTTTLRMIAGFEFPDRGGIFFDDQEVTFLKPNQRNTGMVFQNFALFPHMTVGENVAFGLETRRFRKVEVQSRVSNALEMVGLRGYDTRQITQLSGGQQQRVALARAVVIEPAILLLDEPLSNLDAKLREEMRREIRALQQRLGITTIYVTHDQEEALSLSDHIVVMNHGIVQQIGTPEEVYSQPANEFVANFVGNSNLLPGTYSEAGNEKASVRIASGFELNVPKDQRFTDGASVRLAIKPELIRISLSNENTNLRGQLNGFSFSGAIVNYELTLGSARIVAKSLLVDHDFSLKPGRDISVTINAAGLVLFSAQR
jgi:iron(III) transport system ATP-binding protein